jgi:hypothetical protein
MFHPLMTDLSEKSTEQLLEDINSLSNKLSYMYRLNKADLVRQLTMVLSAYREEYNRRQAEMFNKKMANAADKINISG